MARHGLAPGQGQYLFEDGLSKPSEVVTDFHQRQAASDFRSGHAQAVGQLEVTQGFHLLLKVVFRDARQTLAQLGGQFRRQGWLEQTAFVEQLVEQ